MGFDDAAGTRRYRGEFDRLVRLILSETEPTDEVLLSWASFRARYFPFRDEETGLIVFAGHLKAIEEAHNSQLPVPPIPALGQAIFASRVLVRFAERFLETRNHDAFRTTLRLARRYLEPPRDPDLGYSPSPDLYDLLERLEAKVVEAEEAIEGGTKADPRAETGEPAHIPGESGGESTELGERAAHPVAGQGSDPSVPASPAETASQPPSAIAENAMLSPRQLAGFFGLPNDATKKRLERWRHRNPGPSDWIENPEPRSREPRYFYRLGAVRDALSKPSRKLSRKRPARGNEAT
jgi:hypothetical protein